MANIKLTGKANPYDSPTTLYYVEIDNLRSAEDEGFIPLQGAMRGEIDVFGTRWHVKKHSASAEWVLDCPVGEEPTERKRGRIALDADQTPDLADYK